jgi:mitotic spindle assembly checkpoint protein MAD2
VTASVTFLPLLNEPVSFELLAHTDTAAVVPGAWAESDPRHIAGATSEVQLRSMTTRIHTVAPKVSYRARDEL